MIMKVYVNGKPEIELSIEEALQLQVDLAASIQRVLASRLKNPSQVFSYYTIVDNGKKIAPSSVIFSITKNPEELLPR